jgi:hypothetical protein
MPSMNPQLADMEAIISSNADGTEKFDFRLTEGQSRRNSMADFETDCTPVTDYLYLGGHKVSNSKRFP